MQLKTVAAALLVLIAGTSVQAQQGQPAGVTVVQPWARATPAGAKVGAAYMELKAGAAGADKLLSVASDAAEVVELHTHTMDDGVARMRRVDDIPVPAAGSVALKPGGYHVMLINLKQQLKAGEKIKLTLKFEKAGTVEVDAAVQPIGAQGVGGGQAKGMDHSGHGKH